MTTKPSESRKTSVQGGCLCGAVRFDVDLPSKWCAHCHCTMCQRAHGAGYVTWAGFKKESFRLTQDDQLKWHESSPGARRGFCKTCGSSMLFESARWADETHVALACIDDRIDRQPQANVNYDTHVEWMTADQDLTQV